MQSEGRVETEGVPTAIPEGTQQTDQGTAQTDQGTAGTVGAVIPTAVVCLYNVRYFVSASYYVFK